MKRIHVALLALFSLMVFSCQQEIDPSIITNPGGGNNGGGNTGNYAPLSPGSWWKYKDSASGTMNTMTALNLTKTINGILYRAVKSSTGPAIDTAYQAAPAPNYYYTQKGNSPNTGAPYDLLFNYLNDTASVGFNWTYSSGQGNGFTAISKTTIIEKNITVTVAGITYPNVIHTRLDFAYDIFGTVIDFAVYDYYVAKNVGIVRARANIVFGMSMQTCSDLIDHHIQ
jgi:hypothetical protein